jgi:ribonuclease HII
MICGIDEAGRGPVLGPLVVAGVKLADDKELEKLNVRDSKKLSPERREALASEIRKLAEIEVVVLSANELDLLRQIMTLNEIETGMFSKIITKLKAAKVFVDCVDTNEETFKNNLKTQLDYEPEIISKHKADDIFPVVSAASIIAKTIRDNEVTRISAELGINIGSGYPADPITIEFIKNWLADRKELPPFIRHSWKTTERLWEDYKFTPTKLDDY